jgi:hypothetical protein
MMAIVLIVGRGVIGADPCLPACEFRAKIRPRQHNPGVGNPAGIDHAFTCSIRWAHIGAHGAVGLACRHRFGDAGFDVFKHPNDPWRYDRGTTGSFEAEDEHGPEESLIFVGELAELFDIRLHALQSRETVDDAAKESLLELCVQKFVEQCILCAEASVNHRSAEPRTHTDLGCAGGLVTLFGHEVDQRFEQSPPRVGVLLGARSTRVVVGCGAAHRMILGIGEV